MTPTERRLATIEQRLERLERLAFLGFVQLRQVAEYAYQNAKYEPEPDVRRVPKMRPVSDNEAMAMGMSLADLVSLKMLMARGFPEYVQREVFEIAKALVAQPEQAQKREAAEAA